MLNFCIVNLKVGQPSSHSCHHSDAFQTPWHPATKFCTHPAIASYCKRQTLHKQWGYGSVCFQILYSFLHHWAGLNEAQAKRQCRLIRYSLADNFSSGVGACTKIVEPFKHHLRATAQPQFLVLELQVPTSACPRQYSMSKMNATSHMQTLQTYNVAIFFALWLFPHFQNPEVNGCKQAIQP